MTKRIKIKDSIPKSKWQILTHGLNNSVSNIQSNLVVNDVRRVEKVSTAGMGEKLTMLMDEAIFSRPKSKRWFR